MLSVFCLKKRLLTPTKNLWGSIYWRNVLHVVIRAIGAKPLGFIVVPACLTVKQSRCVSQNPLASTTLKHCIVGMLQKISKLLLWNAVLKDWLSETPAGLYIQQSTCSCQKKCSTIFGETDFRCTVVYLFTLGTSSWFMATLSFQSGRRNHQGISVHTHYERKYLKIKLKGRRLLYILMPQRQNYLDEPSSCVLDCMLYAKNLLVPTISYLSRKSLVWTRTSISGSFSGVRTFGSWSKWRREVPLAVSNVALERTRHQLTQLCSVFSNRNLATDFFWFVIGWFLSLRVADSQDCNRTRRSVEEERKHLQPRLWSSPTTRKSGV
jgi:hypothetical protein